MRTAVRLGLTLDYELTSISEDGKRGGVADTGVPNFIYRWTEREVSKTVASYDPARVPQISFFYDMRIPVQRFTRSGKLALRLFGLALEPLSRLFAAIMPSQCNEFAFCVSKYGPQQAWIAASAMLETGHLLKSPANAARLLRSIAEAGAAKLN